MSVNVPPCTSFIRAISASPIFSWEASTFENWPAAVRAAEFFCNSLRIFIFPWPYIDEVVSHPTKAWISAIYFLMSPKQLLYCSISLLTSFCFHFALHFMVIFHIISFHMYINIIKRSVLAPISSTSCPRQAKVRTFDTTTVLASPGDLTTLWLLLLRAHESRSISNSLFLKLARKDFCIVYPMLLSNWTAAISRETNDFKSSLKCSWSLVDKPPL